jgi:hypothetical protein
MRLLLDRVVRGIVPSPRTDFRASLSIPAAPGDSGQSINLEDDEMRHIAMSALLALGLGLWAGTAWAVDGVIEINQTCATQSGCHPSDAPGFPVTIPTGASYRLTSDLVTSDGNLTLIDGFVPAGPIGGFPANNGTLQLDLNGFSIRCFVGIIIIGGSSCEGTGIGVDFSGIEGASVINGTVKNMGNDGILLGDAGRVRDVYVASNGQFGDGNIGGIRCGEGCQVSHSVADGNGRFGILTGNGSSVVDSQVLNNAQAGMRVGVGSTVARNSVYANAFQGIMDSGGSGIFQNVIYGNGGFGIDSIGGPFAYGQNALRGNNGAGPESDGLGIQTSGNLCDTDTVCP